MEQDGIASADDLGPRACRDFRDRFACGAANAVPSFVKRYGIVGAVVECAVDLGGEEEADEGVGCIDKGELRYSGTIIFINSAESVARAI
ncbi:MAG: hypothetical protein B7Y80_10100 [Hyphomicrobium sp. 32-62-53]|nr:MAG: hypothetical protein B7Z29_08625 [Hyphomicrobium sp. 12-62-95]OYX99918.1 MAG: hypothetical protein B7Y80_10100 [Hyphomicrobium sp. 32-62-53]